MDIYALSENNEQWNNRYILYYGSNCILCFISTEGEAYITVALFLDCD